MITEKKGDASSNFMNEIMERVESKLQNMESNMHFMKADQKKSFENLSRMEVSTLKNSDDFKSIVSQVQSDF